MKKNLSRIAAISSLIFAITYTAFASADVVVGDTVNGVTTVSCTGGCTFGGGGLFGGTTVCDQGGTCVTLRGWVKEKPKSEA